MQQHRNINKLRIRMCIKHGNKTVNAYAYQRKRFWPVCTAIETSVIQGCYVV